MTTRSSRGWPRRGILASVAALSVVLEGTRGIGAGSLVMEISAPRTLTCFGTDVAPAGDHDGDGVADLLVGDTSGGLPGVSGGRVSVVSGASGAVLRDFHGMIPDHIGTPWGDGFGFAVASVGDIDGRGISDVLIGAGENRELPTYARVFAGEDGTTLFDSGRMQPDSRYGSSVACLGDLDGDGIAEFAIGQPHDWRTSTDSPGAVWVHSGADGSLLGLLLGSAGGDGFGESIAPLGDVDGDGVPDFVVGSPGWHPSPRTHAPKGRLDILSGATLEPIRSYRGKRFGRTLGIRVTAMDPRDPLSGSFAHPEYRAGGRVGFTIRDARRRGGHRVFLEERNRVAFGLDMTGLGDVDGDGAPDLAVASRTVQSPDGTDGTTLVEVFSGARRRLVFAWQGVERDGDRLSLSRTGDLDGDGREELVVGIPNAEQALVFRLVDDSDPSLHVRTPR